MLLVADCVILRVHVWVSGCDGSNCAWSCDEVDYDYAYDCAYD